MNKRESFLGDRWVSLIILIIGIVTCFMVGFIIRTDTSIDITNIYNLGLLLISLIFHTKYNVIPYWKRRK